MVVSKEYHSAEVENSLAAIKIQPSILNVFCNNSLRQAMLSCPFFGAAPQQARKESVVQRAPARTVTLGIRTTSGFSRNFSPALISDPLKGKCENGTNALLSLLVFKTFLAVVHLGQCSGTQRKRNTEFRQNCWVPGDGWGTDPGCLPPLHQQSGDLAVTPFQCVGDT